MDDHDREHRTGDLDLLRAQPGDYNHPLDPVRDQPVVSRVAWVVFLVLLAAVALGLWWWASSPRPATPEVRVPSSTSAPAPARPLGSGAADEALPPLGELDDYVRPLLSALSSRPELAALLTSDGLVRRFVVSVDNIARGTSPSRHLQAVAPGAPFQVRAQGSAYVPDPSSYARYEGLVRTVEDVDPARIARLYGRLKPRLEEAYAELGGGGTFDDAMAAAIAHLLATPVPREPMLLQPGPGTNYVYTDARLEGLSGAQRQLLRLGPERARRVQARLEVVGRALGIPADKLRA